MGEICSECGLIHPPTPSGCPVAKAQKQKKQMQEAMGTKLSEAFNQIQREFLQIFQGASEKEIDEAVAKIRNLIMNYKIQSKK